MSEKKAASDCALRVDSIKRNQGKASLHLSNGTVIDMPRAMLRERPYRGGMPFDPEAHRLFIHSRSAAFAMDKAVSLLAARNRTEFELVSALRRNAYPEESIARVMEKLQQAGYINDASFADHWLNVRISKGLGTRRIRMELRQKGVEQDDIEHALSSLDDETLFDSAIKVAQKAARGKDLSSPNDRQKILSALARRGFDYTTSKRALSCIINPLE